MQGLGDKNACFWNMHTAKHILYRPCHGTPSQRSLVSLRIAILCFLYLPERRITFKIYSVQFRTWSSSYEVPVVNNDDETQLGHTL